MWAGGELMGNGADNPACARLGEPSSALGRVHPTAGGSGLSAVGVDAPAHGDSPGEKANVLQYGKALVEAGGELGPLAGIVGHSFARGRR